MKAYEQALREIAKVLDYCMCLSKENMYRLLCEIKNCAQAALVEGKFEPIDKRTTDPTLDEDADDRSPWSLSRRWERDD